MDMSRRTLNNAMLGALAGFGLRVLYDRFNQKNMVEQYEFTGKVPKKKSMLLAILLATVFGSLGLLYSSPRMAVPLLIIEIPLYFLLFAFIFLRPIIIFIALAATYSYNSVAKQLFGHLHSHEKYFYEQ